MIRIGRSVTTRRSLGTVHFPHLSGTPHELVSWVNTVCKLDAEALQIRRRELGLATSTSRQFTLGDLRVFCVFFLESACTPPTSCHNQAYAYVASSKR